ncbi:5895_t:CDS:2 [Ambispora leptoticha]|uniref:5895_t:CDS:1 n=1 Tax=Ambispora leptoticha TaxID=144679 RepID=A0A9N9E453_9GLOM|nr:5895_t:CDS:2 [Ambispora leptoticha]
MSLYQSSIGNSTTPYPFYMGLISRSNKTSPILSFLEKKIEIEKSKISKEPLNEWFPPKSQFASHKLEAKIETSSMNLKASVNDYDKSHIPYDRYLGLEEKKPKRYLKQKTAEKLSYEFRIGLGELLPPKINRSNELHAQIFDSKSLNTKKKNSKFVKQIEKNNKLNSRQSIVNKKVESPKKKILLKTSRELPKLKISMPQIKGKNQYKNHSSSKKSSSRIDLRKDENNVLLQNSKSSIPRFHKK